MEGNDGRKDHQIKKLESTVKSLTEDQKQVRHAHILTIYLSPHTDNWYRDKNK